MKGVKQIIDYRFIKKNGSSLWCILSSAPLFDNNNKFDGSIAMITDITDRKLAEQALQESEAQAQGLVKQLKAADESKNMFLNTLSHELRNPLAAIDAWLQLAESSSLTIDVPKVQMILRRQVDQLVRMVEDLLEVSRIMNNKIVLRKETVELNGVVEAEVATHKLRYDSKGIELDFVMPRSPVIIQADPVRITQVVGNLLNNALKFTDAGGTVRVTVCEDHDQVEISVSDNGAGIEAELLPVIFDPFVQAAQSLDRSNGGMGIGLSIVKRITELHGGTVMAKSGGSGKGATFIVRLPLEKGAEIKREASESKGTKRALHILVIEDNKDLADAISMALSLAGHTFAIAHDGLRGLEMFEAENPDFVLCDIGLPGIDGYEFARQVRAKAAGEHAYLIALSGYGSLKDVENAIKAGFNDYLVKPINLALIQDTMNKASENRYKK
jgi:signal transduction histidine kinase/ActR/RegA family two-component response regulator